MSTLLRFQPRQSTAVLSERAQADDDIVSSLPELFAAVHVLTHVDVAGVRFASCICGYVQRVHGDDFPSMCSLDAAVQMFRAELLCRYGQMVARALAAGARDEREYASLAGSR